MSAISPQDPTTSCTAARQDLSARLDREATVLPGARLDEHVAGCAACRAWLSQAERVTERVRRQQIDTPDLTVAILEAVAAERAVAIREHRRQLVARWQVLRVALGVSALVQLLLALPALLAGLGVAGVVDPHTSREAASFDIALAVGFALAAWRPERARAFVPVAFVLAACLTATSAFDIAGGVTALAHEIGHVAALAQAMLLWALSRTTAWTAGPRESSRPVTVAA
jgi:predicted anti-sigma-YlaC factor YlaD